MEKKINLGSVATDAGKVASGIFSKAKDAVVSAVDQNGDGKLGLDDVSFVSDSVKATVKENSKKWSDKQEHKRREKELEALRPIFESDVDKPDFSLPKFIRLAEIDELHEKSDVCKNSIGFIFSGKDLDITTIYRDKTGIFDLQFDPDTDSELYYVDPTDRDQYISIEKYFNYLKIKRISELQRIAQSLGARHFKVIYKEKQAASSGSDIKGGISRKAKGSQSAGIEAAHHAHEYNSSKVEIAADMDCIGHPPKEPDLVYFRKDPQIQSLVAMRMDDNTLVHQHYTLNLIESSGIKKTDAIKIDAALGAMNKVKGSAFVTSEVEKEMQRVFEYEIDF